MSNSCCDITFGITHRCTIVWHSAKPQPRWFRNWDAGLPICMIVMGIVLLSYLCEWESVRFVHSGSKIHTPSNGRHSNQLLKTCVHTQQEFLEIYPHADISIMVGILHVGLISFQVLFGTMGDLCTYVQYIWSYLLPTLLNFLHIDTYIVTSNILDLWTNLLLLL